MKKETIINQLEEYLTDEVFLMACSLSVKGKKVADDKLAEKAIDRMNGAVLFAKKLGIPYEEIDSLLTHNRLQIYKMTKPTP